MRGTPGARQVTNPAFLLSSFIFPGRQPVTYWTPAMGYCELEDGWGWADETHSEQSAPWSKQRSRTRLPKRVDDVSRGLPLLSAFSATLSYIRDGM